MFHIKFLETKGQTEVTFEEKETKFIPIFFFNFAVKAIYKTQLIFEFVENNMDYKML